MALPKSKHLRNLTIQDTQYYWKAEEDSDLKGLKVTVGLATSPHKKFTFYFRFNYPKLKNLVAQERMKQTSITPKLICDSIAFAKNNFDWPESKTTCEFKHQNGRFVLC